MAPDLQTDTGTSRDSSASPAPRALTSVEPIVPGFHPDPTICRVGGDYYLAHSSFEYTPGVPIWHSVDLLRWEQIGNALDRDDQFDASGAGASRGVFAPTLRHHDGRFWLITTDVSDTGGQLLVSAADPAGPWSPGTRIPGITGIDPDLVWVDGQCYVTYCSTDPELVGIAQARVDLDSGAVLEEPRVIWRGTGLAFPEAPHLYEHDGWWYLIIAEGGTERGHGVSVARSLSPEGPFESHPANPVFSHRSTTHPVQNTGHADFVQVEDGSWAVIYLGVRPEGVTPMFHVNGRETFLAGVDWVDGWPRIDERRFTTEIRDRSFTDDFAGPRLHPRWVSPRAELSKVVDHSGGRLLLLPDEPADRASTLLGFRVPDRRWRFESDLETDAPGLALRLRLDDSHWCEVMASAGEATAAMRIGPLETPVGAVVALGQASVTLGIEAVDSATDGPDDLLLYVVRDGIRSEIARADGRYLSTEVAGGFTGRVVGVRAIAEPVAVRSVRYVSVLRASSVTGD